MFKKSGPPPEDDEPRIILLPPPNYAAEVERQLRIAETARWAEVMWAEILRDYEVEARRQKYITVRRAR